MPTSLAPVRGKLPRPLRGVTLGVAAMAASDVPIADLIPHLVYGVVTAAAYSALRER